MKAVSQDDASAVRTPRPLLWFSVIRLSWHFLFMSAVLALHSSAAEIAWNTISDARASMSSVSVTPTTYCGVNARAADWWKTTISIKPRRTQRDIEQLLGRYHQSGQTVQAFSDVEGVASSSMYKWLRRERTGVRVPELVEVSAVARPSTGFAVGTPHGYRIEVPGGFSSEELRRLLGVLEA